MLLIAVAVWGLLVPGHYIFEQASKQRHRACPKPNYLPFCGASVAVDASWHGAKSSEGERTGRGVRFGQLPQSRLAWLTGVVHARVLRAYSSVG